MSFRLPPSSILATPLTALDMVVLDTETTGLDVERDRVVELAAVRVRGGEVREEETFATLVNPGARIGETARAIHGIGEEDVAAAPDFAQAMARFTEWAGASVIGGYMVGFDLAVLKAEHARHDLPWTQPLALDVRGLARLCAPQLPDESLETVAAWLGVEIDGRHRALPDALAAARILSLLGPRLRAQGIATLGQALRATRETQAREHAATGQGAPQPEPPATLAAPRAIDSYPFRHRVRDVMRAELALGRADMSLRAALREMLGHKVSSLFLPPAEGEEDWGIITERDILRAIDSHGPGALEHPLARHVSRPLVAVAENEFVYRAIARMTQLGLRHLAVRRRTDDAIIGAISQRDLLRYRAMEALALNARIERARTPRELARVWPTLVEVARAMQVDNAPPGDIAAVISRELRALTARACRLAEQAMIEEGRGAAPTTFGMMVLGSAGRGESLLAMDQDNALVHAETDARGRAWFADFGQRVNDMLHEAGVPHCPGGVMAGNARWRKSHGEWLAAVRGWLGEAAPEDLLHTDIFFDLRRACGSRDLVRELRAQCLDMAKGARTLLKFLAAQAARFDSPLGWFGRLRARQGRVDLKKGGLMPIFSAARVLALRMGSRERSTPGRLNAALRAGICPPHLARDLMEAHRILLGLVLAQQLRDLERGLAPSNKVAPAELNRYQRDELRWALERVMSVPALLGVPPLPD